MEVFGGHFSVHSKGQEAKSIGTLEAGKDKGKDSAQRPQEEQSPAGILILAQGDRVKSATSQKRKIINVCCF